MATYVITEACIGVKDATCVEVCPVSCIHTTSEAPQYYIDPEICIACEQCVIVCPVKAIYLDSDVPSELENYIQINADFFKENKAEAPPISLSEAKAMIETVQTFAAGRGLKVAIAIVNPAGETVLAASMVGAEEAAAKQALDKAYCSARLELPTHELRSIAQAAGSSDGAEASNQLPPGFDRSRFISDMGGHPFVEDINLYGAIGVAGADSGQLDMLCCQTAITTLKTLR
jgi:uncharacterized protein GlcG (DUF336 family)/NAD-dependent dihydropyrimidine dehydrogenase PreA subunit